MPSIDGDFFFFVVVVVVVVVVSRAFESGKEREMRADVTQMKTNKNGKNPAKTSVKSSKDALRLARQKEVVFIAIICTDTFYYIFFVLRVRKGGCWGI